MTIEIKWKMYESNPRSKEPYLNYVVMEIRPEKIIFFRPYSHYYLGRVLYCEDCFYNFMKPQYTYMISIYSNWKILHVHCLAALFLKPFRKVMQLNLGAKKLLSGTSTVPYDN